MTRIKDFLDHRNDLPFQKDRPKYSYITVKY